MAALWPKGGGTLGIYPKGCGLRCANPTYAVEYLWLTLLFQPTKR